MDEHETQPPTSVPAAPVPPAPSEAPWTPTAAPNERDGRLRRTSWRGRLLGLRGTAAVAVAGVVLGGFGGAALGVAGDDGGDSGPGGGFRGGPLQQGGLPHGPLGGTAGGGRGGLPGRDGAPLDRPHGAPGGLPPRTSPRPDVRPGGGGEVAASNT